MKSSGESSFGTYFGPCSEKGTTSREQTPLVLKVTELPSSVILYIILYPIYSTRSTINQSLNILLYNSSLTTIALLLLYLFITLFCNAARLFIVVCIDCGDLVVR